MMNLSTAFILYLVLFRLSIIATGIVSIILGYRLFCKGVGWDKNAGKGSEATAEIAGSKFTLKNAAPGSFFAFFGVLIISIMFAAGGPQLTLKSLQEAAGLEQLSRNTPLELTLRNQESNALDAVTQQGLYYEEQRDTANAIATYEKAVGLMAAPMNNLAWLYLEQGRTAEALPLSQMAVQLTPHHAGYLDTYAEALFKTGNYREALKIMEQAAGLDSRFRDKLPKYRRAVQN
jgi:tetratricopeptide (TPR) repeat protein